MGLTTVERVLLERRLSRRRRAAQPLVGVIGLGLAAFLLAPMIAAGLAVLAGGLVYTALADEVNAAVKSIDKIEDREFFETTGIYDRNGTLLREIAPQGKRTYVKIAEIPPLVRQATLAVEDSDFYTNMGVDPGGTLRAAWGEVSDQQALGGGSTITQQLVRNVAFSWKERQARSYERKAKEIVLALVLTRQHSKDQILEWYLNEIYYGNLAYGIEAAAQTIFGKSARELDLAETALLVGLPQAPGDLDPLNPDPDIQSNVKDRQATVLSLMVDSGVVTQAEADAAEAKELAYASPEADEGRLKLAPHFVEYVQDLLEAKVGADLIARGGIRVTTTLDMKLQTRAEEVLREQVDKLRDRHNMTNAALVAMEPRTGQVLAMVGSYDYLNEAIDGQVNVALRERQPGSSIKPITYLTALEHGMSPATILWDVPMEVWTGSSQGLYKPNNYDGAFHGPVRLRRALANSYNIPALKLLGTIPPKAPGQGGDDAAATGETEEEAARMGVEATIDTAHRMGVTGLQRDPWDYGLSLTLGGGEVKLIDMTTAFATMANLGERVRPNPVLKITDSAGTVLYDLHEDEAALAPVRAVSEESAYIVTDWLADNTARTPAFGSSSPLNIGVPAAVKTGTTNDYHDNWTLGYTPYLVTGVWAGNSDNSKMRDTSGVTGAAPIWSAFMRNVAADEELRGIVAQAREDFGHTFTTQFARPKGVVEARICRVESLNQLAATCQSYDTELFVKDKLPKSGAAGAGGDGTLQVSSVVVPLPPPPEEAVRAAEAAKRPLRWAPAILCLPGQEGFGADKAQPVTVLPLPEDVPGSTIGEERRFVIEWARANGWAPLAPTEPCTQPMIDAAMVAGSLPGFGSPGVVITPTLGVSYRLNLRPESVLTARTVLTGTVSYNPAEIEYFKVELGAGRQPMEWITLGSTHAGPVMDGTLETLDAPSLPAGDYIVRLVLVKKDGNFLDPPFSVPIRIGR
jgi:membrane peptidoglycan carboxypeptidase